MTCQVAPVDNFVDRLWIGGRVWIPGTGDLRLSNTVNPARILVSMKVKRILHGRDVGTHRRSCRTSHREGFDQSQWR